MSQLSKDVDAAFALCAELRARIIAIKALVCGDAEPRWPNDLRVTAMRGRIADLCDGHGVPVSEEVPHA